MKKFVLLAFIVFSAVIVTFADNLNIVSRARWGASPPRHAAKKLDQIPAPYVIISHEGNSVCTSRQNCVNHMRNIQAMHVGQKGSDDIVHNFLVGGDGNVYEGRCWEATGDHTDSYNAKSIGIAFIGNFEYKEPSLEQLEAARNLLEYGVQKGKLASNYKLLGQRQVKVTQSPGNKLYNIIKTWEHYSSA